jgi:phage shock protein A
MFKQLSALFRGRAFEAGQGVIDRNALAILRQQIRDCAQAVEMSRKAVAVAMAQNEQEQRQHAQLLRQIDDLETRTLSALDQGREDLARDAAEAIAHLEAERDVSAQAQARFQTEITRLRSVLREAETRLRQLQRGQRLAAATDKTQQLQVSVPDSGLSTLREAEDTLQRLQERQGEIDATARAMSELEATGSAETTREKLAAAGCGAPLKTSADDVLDRLKRKSNTAEETS